VSCQRRKVIKKDVAAGERSEPVESTSSAGERSEPVESTSSCLACSHICVCLYTITNLTWH